MKLTRILKIAAPAAAVLCLYPLTAHIYPDGNSAACVMHGC